MHILTVIGARPQFIKAAVLSRYIRNNYSLGITENIIHTGQHYDDNMSDIFFKEMGIPKPKINLNAGSGNHGYTTSLMLKGIEKVIIEKQPDALLVYGDTNSTLAGALAASKLNIPIIHIEAGLRSFMMIMPEEQNRKLTDHLSTWLFCPTSNAVKNLENEGIIHNKLSSLPSSDNKYVYLSGDIMYEASLFYRNKINKKSDDENFILMTIHRAENLNNANRLKSIVSAINKLDNHKFIFPIHPGTNKILNEYGLYFNNHVKLIPPIGYLEMISYEMSCSAVFTDSGGLQKEAYFYKKPCITIRDSTEWIELVESGWNTITGTDPEKIIFAVNNIKIPYEYPLLYGDGNCAKKICEVLIE